MVDYTDLENGKVIAMKSIDVSHKVFLTRSYSIADGMNFMGVMPGPDSLADY
mgnify:CR=1 FL=1